MKNVDKQQGRSHTLMDQLRDQTMQSKGNNEKPFHEMINVLPAAIYITDAEGWVVHFNPACVALAGRTPVLGVDRWCITWKLERPDGSLLPHDQCPMAIAIKENRPVTGAEAIAVRPDGKRVWFAAYPTPLRDSKGNLTGAINMLVDITENRQTQLQLLQSEEKYRTLFNSMGEGFCILEKISDNPLDFRFIEANSAFELQTGVKNIIGKTLCQIFPYVAEKWTGIANAVFFTGKPFQFEEAFLNQKLILEFYVFQIKRRSQNFIGVIVKNITRRKKEEAASHWLASIVETTDDAIVSKTLDGFITSWNHSAEKMFGYTAKEAIGQHITLIVPPELYKDEEDVLAKLRRGEKVSHFETVRQNKNGSRLTISETISPIRDNTGRIIGASKIARDITGQKRAERALRESEERLRITLDAIGMGTWDWNIVSDKIVWNKQQYLLLGLDPEKEKDMPKNLAYFLQFINQKDAEKAKKKLKTAAEEGVNNIYQDQFRIIRANDGKQRWMNRYGRKVKDENGHFTHIVGVMYDITERKFMERQKDEFIGIASHELKTPVTSIKMYVELILQMLKEKEDIQNVDMLQKLDRQVDRLVELINDLLDTTRIDEGKLSLNIKPFDLNELIEECEEAFQPTKRHKIIFLAGELKQVWADRERIGQVITNLISNAIKYSPESEEIVITSEQIENGVKVSVRDTGIGISKELLPKIFNRFSRIDNPQTFPGIGLGLYISAEIIRRHGGIISVESPPKQVSRAGPPSKDVEGKGSLFYFTLPYNRES